MINRTFVNIVNAVCVSWLGLVATGQIGNPAPQWVHWVNILVLVLSGTLAHLGFDRTPNGTVIQTAERRFIDDSKNDATRQAMGTVVESSPVGSQPVLTDDSRKKE